MKLFFFCLIVVRRVFVVQDSNKRAAAAEQDRAQLDMQIQTYKQNRGLFSFFVGFSICCKM